MHSRRPADSGKKRSDDDQDSTRAKLPSGTWIIGLVALIVLFELGEEGNKGKLFQDVWRSL